MLLLLNNKIQVLSCLAEKKSEEFKDPIELEEWFLSYQSRASNDNMHNQVEDSSLHLNDLA